MSIFTLIWKLVNQSEPKCAHFTYYQDDNGNGNLWKLQLLFLVFFLHIAIVAFAANWLCLCIQMCRLYNQTITVWVYLGSTSNIVWIILKCIYIYIYSHYTYMPDLHKLWSILVHNSYFQNKRSFKIHIQGSGTH